MSKKLLTRAQFAELAGVSGAAVTKAAAASLKAAVSGKFIDAAHPDALEYVEKKARAQTPPAAIGIDPMYEEAVELCQNSDRWSVNHISKGLNIGTARAKRIFATIQAADVQTTPKREQAIDEHIKKKAPHVRGTAARREKMKAAPVEEDDEPLGIPDNIAEYADMTLREIIFKFGTDTRFVDWLKAVKSIEDIHEKRLKNEQTEGNLVNRDLIRTGVIEPLNTAHVKMMTDGAKAISVRVPAMAAAGEDTIKIEHYVSGVISSFIRPVAAKVERVIKNA